MLWLTEDAVLKCDHGGRVDVTATQDFVRIEGRRVLVRPNPERRPISVCTNDLPSAGIRRCLRTQEARAGYSTLVTIADSPVCLDSVLGYTDGSPPRTSNYTVKDPAQAFVEAAQ
jgi:hypothetical protein